MYVAFPAPLPWMEIISLRAVAAPCRLSQLEWNKSWLSWSQNHSNGQSTESLRSKSAKKTAEHVVLENAIQLTTRNNIFVINFSLQFFSIHLIAIVFADVSRFLLIYCLSGLSLSSIHFATTQSFCRVAYHIFHWNLSDKPLIVLTHVLMALILLSYKLKLNPFYPRWPLDLLS